MLRLSNNKFLGHRSGPGLYLCLLVAVLFCLTCTDNSSLSPQLPALCNFESLKREVLIPPTDSCRRAPWPPRPIIGFQEITKGYRDFLNVVNPNNPYQIAVIHYIDSLVPNQAELWVIDLCTKEKRFLVDQVIDRVQWSVKDWLLVNRLDLQIWKIKANGDSLTQLTSGSINTRPNWNKRGDKILFRRLTNPGEVFVIISEIGEVLQSINSPDNFRWPLWSPDESELLVYLPITGYHYLLDLASMDTTRIEILGDSAVHVVWSDDAEYWYWTTQHALYKTHISSSNTEKILSQDCNNQFYGAIFPHEDQINAYFATQIMNPLELPNIYIDHPIYWLELETGVLWELDMEALWKSKE